MRDLIEAVEKVKADTVVMTYLDIPDLPTLRLQGRATGVNLRIEDLLGYNIIAAGSGSRLLP